MRGIKFKKFTFNWLSIMIGIHYGRNPATGRRFLHVAPIPFFGLDFYWPEDHEEKGIRFGLAEDTNLYRPPTDVLFYTPGRGEPPVQVFSDVSHEEADDIAQVVLGNLDPYPGESYSDYHRRSERAERIFCIQYPNWKRGRT